MLRGINNSTLINLGTSKIQQDKAKTTTVPQADSQRRYDQIILQNKGTTRSPFQAELAQKISESVRANTSESKLERIGKEIANGSYSVNAQTIAQNLLLESGV